MFEPAVFETLVGACPRLHSIRLSHLSEEDSPSHIHDNLIYSTINAAARLCAMSLRSVHLDNVSHWVDYECLLELAAQCKHLTSLGLVHMSLCHSGAHDAETLLSGIAMR